MAALWGCEGPPQGSVGTLAQMAVVLDPAVFEAVKVFDVHVLAGEVSGGAVLTCSDIPGNYRVDSSKVKRLVDPPPTAEIGESPNQPVIVPQFIVPAERKLVIVVRGLFPFNGTYVSARGCVDNLTFEKGSTQSIDIDAKATTGKTCSAPDDCEPGATCVQGPGFADGYCAVTGCAGGQTCPPGSACISDAALGGLCMRLCRSPTDCAITMSENQDCIGRLGPSASGCSRVCVYPLWNKDNCCPSSVCGGGS